MKIIVCGGRDYTDRDAVFKALDALHAIDPVDEVIEGGARGADFLGREWATARQVPVRTFPADWDKHGKAAGHRRNSQMLHEGKPHAVVAFPGGRGTANMVMQAKAAEKIVWCPLGGVQC